MKTEKLLGVQLLRAISVIAVVAFHFYPNLVPYGYLGVDIFFVISGFIISYIYGTKKFSAQSINSFLYKRFLRIYPSLIIVLLFVILVSILFDRNENLYKTGIETILSLLSLINIYFSLFNSDYFELEITNNPLLHLWSISTEVQFYLIFPLITLILSIPIHKIKYFVITFFLTFSIISYLNIIEFDSFLNYYMLHTRIWQFSIGIFIFQIYNKIKNLNFTLSKNSNYILESIFFLLIVSFIYELPASANTFIVTFFSGIFILISALTNDHFFIFKRLFQIIGDLSYSIYLWHWVVLYLIKKYFFFNLSTSLLGILVIFAIAFLSYNYWEVKVRKLSNLRNSKRYMIFLTCTIIAVLALSLISQTKFVSNRFKNEKQLLSNYKLWESSSYLEMQCFLDFGEDFSKWGSKCMKLNSKENVLFWGDSHAVALAQAFEEFNVNKERDVSLLSTSNCPPILNLNSKLSSNTLCKMNNSFVFDFIKRSQTKNVVLASRWYIYSNKEWYESGLRSLQLTIFKLKEIGVQNIYLLASSPEWDESLAENLWRRAIFSSSFPQYLSNPRISLLQDINFNLSELALDARINYLDPIKIWCDDQNCKTYNSPNFYLYQVDTDHLSVDSATELLRIFKLI